MWVSDEPQKLCNSTPFCVSLYKAANRESRIAKRYLRKKYAQVGIFRHQPQSTLFMSTGFEDLCFDIKEEIGNLKNHASFENVPRSFLPKLIPRRLPYIGFILSNKIFFMKISIWPISYYFTSRNIIKYI